MAMQWMERMLIVICMHSLSLSHSHSLYNDLFWILKSIALLSSLQNVYSFDYSSYLIVHTVCSSVQIAICKHDTFMMKIGLLWPAVYVCGTVFSRHLLSLSTCQHATVICASLLFILCLFCLSSQLLLLCHFHLSPVHPLSLSNHYFLFLPLFFIFLLLNLVPLLQSLFVLYTLLVTLPWTNSDSIKWIRVLQGVK